MTAAAGDDAARLNRVAEFTPFRYWFGVIRRREYPMTTRATLKMLGVCLIMVLMFGVVVFLVIKATGPLFSGSSPQSVFESCREDFHDVAVTSGVDEDAGEVKRSIAVSESMQRQQITTGWVEQGVIHLLHNANPTSGRCVFARFVKSGRPPSQILRVFPERNTYHFELLDDGWVYWVYG